eukprot:TRINITY_DN32107_c0_g1_i1.p1 TRINITY_DN32107_c0_g1~~TRINITY_DN32107_c0_g1_i1.p1  ORF type:complete len:402 (+),score=68.14 TRINITY_DN32107_c0_g1_i1:100-1305(+)
MQVDIGRDDDDHRASPIVADSSLLATKWLILLWYTCSVIGNMTSKMLLMRFHYASTVMMGPSIFGSLCVPFLGAFLPDRWVGWVLTGNVSDSFHRHRWRPASLLRTALSRKRVCAVLGVLSLGAGLFHRIALVHVHVSFAHTVKAIQPLYTCAFSYVVFRTLPSRKCAMALGLVVFGIMISAFEEVSADVVGVLALQMSVACASIGSITQKFIFTGLDRAEVYTLTVATATLLNVGVWLVNDLPEFYNKYSKGEAIHTASSTWEVVGLALLNAVTLAMQHFTSLSALQKLLPTTHSTIGCMKRVIIIVAAGIFFGNPITPKNWVGAALAVWGVTWYEIAKKNPKHKAADGKAKPDALSFTTVGSPMVPASPPGDAPEPPTELARWLGSLSPRRPQEKADWV